MKQNRKFLALFLVLLFLMGCGGQLGQTSQQPTVKPSADWAVFYALESSIKLYDVAMTTASELYRVKAIDQAKWSQIKGIGQKFYDHWTAAEKAARKWSQTPEGPEKITLLQEVERLMAAYVTYQTQLASVVKK